MFVRLCLYQNHHRLLVVDLRRQKEVDADFKTIQQIDLLKKIHVDGNATDARNDQSVLS